MQNNEGIDAAVRIRSENVTYFCNLLPCSYEVTVNCFKTI